MIEEAFNMRVRAHTLLSLAFSSIKLRKEKIEIRHAKWRRIRAISNSPNKTLRFSVVCFLFVILLIIGSFCVVFFSRMTQICTYIDNSVLILCITFPYAHRTTTTVCFFGISFRLEITRLQNMSLWLK